MDLRTVLIISDDAAFARSLIGRWQSERTIPAFTQMSSDLGNGASGAEYDLAVVGPLVSTRLCPILDVLDPSVRPIVFVGPAPDVNNVRDAYPRVLALRQFEGWPGAVVLLCTEVLRRVDANERAGRAEALAAAGNRFAILGRYMIEMRHSFNNALTSVLGNAELLLLEPGTLSVGVREQIETIHSMGIRLHEIMQRFSSLDSEMKQAEKKSQAATAPVTAVASSRP